MPANLNVLFNKDPRLVVGVMSGTSMDGIDVALVRFSGSGDSLTWDVVGSHSMPYLAALASEIRLNADPATSSVKSIALLNVRLAHAYAEAITIGLDSFDTSPATVDLIGLHGQTVFHHPERVRVADEMVSATLQLGDPSVLANLLGCPVVGDFRLADMALGGQGAPLVPYLDHTCFGSISETRLLLNLGGIANISVLPAGGSATDVIAFDTGPANLITDGVCRKLFDAPFDRGGEWASEGRADADLVAALMEHPYFDQSPPKSTGAELFSPAYVDLLIEKAMAGGLSRHDILATAASLTVQSIVSACERFVQPFHRVDRVAVAGGGVHNRCLMDGLRIGWKPIPVESIASLGMDPDYKEAVCFALLAHETMNGVATNLPSATGAFRETILGKICIPIRATQPPTSA